MRTLTLTALSVVLLLGFEATTTPASAVPLGNVEMSSASPPTRARSILEKVGWREGYGYGYGYYAGPRYSYGSYYSPYRYSYGSYYPSYRYSTGGYCPPSYGYSGYYPSYGYYGWRRW
jgi:hypothetical protein